MKSAEHLIDLVWLAISVFVCLQSVRMNFGSFHSPGPGFFPLLSGGALGILAAVDLMSNVAKGQVEGKTPSPWVWSNCNKVILAIVFLIVCSILLSKLGYLIVVFALMFLLFGIGMKRSRGWLLIISGSVSVLTYLVFRNLLSIPLPKGIFGF